VGANILVAKVRKLINMSRSGFVNHVRLGLLYNFEVQVDNYL